MDDLPAFSIPPSFDKVKELPVLQQLKSADPEYGPNSRIDLILGIWAVNRCLLDRIVKCNNNDLKAKETTLIGLLGEPVKEKKHQHQNPFASEYRPPRKTPTPSSSSCGRLNVCPAICLHTLKRNTFSQAISWHCLQGIRWTLHRCTSKEDSYPKVVKIQRSSWEMSTSEPEVSQIKWDVGRFLPSHSRVLRDAALWSRSSSQFEQAITQDLLPSDAWCRQAKEHYVKALCSVLCLSQDIYKHLPKWHVVSWSIELPSTATVLTRFWTHRVAISADISIMFREVSLQKEEREFHWVPATWHRGRICGHADEVSDFQYQKLPIPHRFSFTPTYWWPPSSFPSGSPDGQDRLLSWRLSDGRRQHRRNHCPETRAQQSPQQREEEMDCLQCTLSPYCPFTCLNCKVQVAVLAFLSSDYICDISEFLLQQTR